MTITARNFPTRMNLKRIFGLVFTCGAALSLVACGSNEASISALAGQNSFSGEQVVTNGKLDVLWVIDNSGSMRSSQTNLANNFTSFIEKFNSQGYDYRLAVTTSDAYKDLFGAPTTQSRFRDGTDATGHTGFFLVTPLTPDLNNVFLKNVLQGINGSGDERVFQSLKQTLLNPSNAGFPRPDAFLSVIILSDEDDFSWDGNTTIDGQYSNPGLHTVQSYVDFLDSKTLSTAANRKYNVNSITVLDQACLDTLNATNPGRRIGTRYMQLSDTTNGIKGSLCGNFADTLASISSKIIELTTQFYLNRLPIVSTVRVYVNGSEIPQSATDGYTYNSTNNSVVFHGSSVPGPGAAVNVTFDPISLL